MLPSAQTHTLFTYFAKATHLAHTLTSPTVSKIRKELLLQAMHPEESHVQPAGQLTQ